MSGRSNRLASPCCAKALRLTVTCLLTFGVALAANAQQRREREPNSVYAQRRAKLASTVDGPIVLMGYTRPRRRIGSVRLRAGRKLLLPDRP